MSEERPSQGAPNERDEVELRGTTILDRSSWLARWAMVAFGVAGVLGVAFAWTPALGVAFAALVAAAYLSHKPPLAGAPHTTLFVGEDGIRSGMITVAERAEILDGALWPKTTHGTIVQLRRRWFAAPIEIAVASLDDGRALLERLQLASPRAVAKFSAGSRMRLLKGARFPLVFAAMFLLLGLEGATLAARFPMAVAAVAGLLLVPLTIFAPFLVQAWPSTVRIGSDGVFVTWLAHRKMIRFADIESVTVRPVGIQFHLRGGATYDLVTDRPGGFGVRDAILERIRVALEHHRSMDVGPLERRGRGVVEWLASLRALNKRVEGFRDVPFDEPQLWRVLEDPSTSATAKAGAAIALSSTLDDRGRERLRVVRESTVSPKLRVALDAAEEHDDEALRAALEDLEEERSR